MMERKPMIERVRLGTCRSLVRFRKVSRGFARVLASEKAIRAGKKGGARFPRKWYSAAPSRWELKKPHLFVSDEGLEVSESFGIVSPSWDVQEFISRKSWFQWWSTNRRQRLLCTLLGATRVAYFHSVTSWPGSFTAILGFWKIDRIPLPGWWATWNQRP